MAIASYLKVAGVIAAVGTAVVVKPMIQEWLFQRALQRKAERQASRQSQLINQYCAQISAEVCIGEEMEENEPIVPPVETQVVPNAPLPLEPTGIEFAQGGGFHLTGPIDAQTGFEIAQAPAPVLAMATPPPVVRVSEKRQKLPKRGLPYATRVGFEARAQVGLLERTRANYLVYQRICRDIMKEHGVRATHIAAALPVAISAAFTPSDTDIISSRAMSGATVSRLHSLLGGFKGH
jgi:hypothetical protein